LLTAKILLNFKVNCQRSRTWNRILWCFTITRYDHALNGCC